MKEAIKMTLFDYIFNGNDPNKVSWLNQKLPLDQTFPYILH